MVRQTSYVGVYSLGMYNIYFSAINTLGEFYYLALTFHILQALFIWVLERL